MISCDVALFEYCMCQHVELVLCMTAFVHWFSVTSGLEAKRMWSTGYL